MAHTKNRKSDSDMMPMKAICGLALQLGFAVSAVTILCVYGGHVLDDYFGTAPYLFFLGIALGLLASIGLVWQIVAPIRARASSDFLTK